MKIYYIIFYAFFAVALYNFVYVTSLQERTYFQYVREFHNAGDTFPQYIIGEDSSNEPDAYEFYNIPSTGRYLNLVYLQTYPYVILLFFPLLIYGIVVFFVKKKYLDKKWLMLQLIGYTCLFYIVHILLETL